ncbi:uncharacterized protein LOC133860613 [Alnus glutinosa]|uniref:uncharacterized protein LOC133860613 n=1 Tax=Alnus glutinosa TaxID=3517 RepID=UPI002D79D119|nr:uncharacterized protein LOC133860613 [Alnus glutinosa]
MEGLIESMSEGLKLSEGERKEITITESDTADLRGRSERCLLGKLMSDRRIQKEAFKTLMSRLWKTIETVAFKEIQDNLWLLEFSNRADKRRVLEGRPWLFDRSLLVLKEIDEDISPSQMDFSKALFWIQVHDMPLTCMNREVGLRIGQSIGDVEDIDVTGDGVGWGRYLRIRVSVDITKPLERGRAIVLNGKSIWVLLKYEKLPQFCYHCGRIYHEDKACPRKSNFRINEEVSAKAWGVWLRADGLHLRKEGSSAVRQSAYNARNQVLADQEPGVREGDDRLPGDSSVMQGGGEIHREAPAGRASDGPAEKMDVLCTTDFMESDENMGGKTGINEEDLGGDLEGEIASDSGKGEGHQRDKPLTISDTEVINQNDTKIRGVQNEVGCIEPRAEDSHDRKGATLNKVLIEDSQVAGRMTPNTNVAVKKIGSQLEGSLVQPSTEETPKTLSKVRKWKRKTKDITRDDPSETDRKRKFEDVEWIHPEDQEHHSKKRHSGGELLLLDEEAVADSQLRLSP